KSFSLVELLIVIAIIMVIGATAFLILSQWLSRTKDARQLSDISTLKKGLTIYYSENSSFPKPGNSISIDDEKGKSIGVQGYFDESVTSQMRSFGKTVKDPSTNKYYSYTRYENNKGFEIATFLSKDSKYTNFYNSSVFADGVSTPYVNVYGNAGYCDPSGGVSLPNPMSMFDKTSNKFLARDVLGDQGKVLLNLNFLIGKSNGNGCTSQASAPIIGVVGTNSKINVSQATDKQLTLNVDLIKNVINKLCTDESGMCNMPDIYRINYNYILLLYKFADGSIKLVELYWDEQTKEYKILGAIKEVYNGSGSNAQDGTVYQVSGISSGGYSIIYMGESGIVNYYKTSIQKDSNGTYVDFNIPSDTVSFATKSSGGNSISDNNSTVVGIKSENPQQVSPTKIVYYNNGDSSPKEILLPFECKLPKIINIDLDVYVIAYIGSDGNLHINKIKIGNSGNILSNTSLPVNGDYGDIASLEFTQIWENVFVLKSIDGSGVSKVIGIKSDGISLTKTDQLTIESQPITNYYLVEVGGGFFNVTYNIATNGYIKLVHIDANGKLTLRETSEELNCVNIKLITLQQGNNEVVCENLQSYKTNTQESLSNVSTVLSCKGELPENAKPNGDIIISKTWSYNQTEGECNYICDEGYEYVNGKCNLILTFDIQATNEENIEICENVKFEVNVNSILGNVNYLYKYSFDGGNSWGDDNSIMFSGTSYTLTTGSIQVMDAGGDINVYNNQVIGKSSSCIVTQPCYNLPSNALFYNNTATYGLVEATFMNSRNAQIAGHSSTPIQNTCEWKCKAGYYYNGTNGCTAAPTGHYVPIAGALSPTPCTNLPSDTRALYGNSSALKTNSCPISCVSGYGFNGTKCVTSGRYYCATEGGTCRFYGTKTIRYGASGRYKYKTLTTSTACSNAVFGDPIGGAQKYCHVYY
ncbi:MAG: type II secretion system protein, partial [Candidatus Absconditabacteria bacterium]